MWKKDGTGYGRVDVADTGDGFAVGDFDDKGVFDGGSHAGSGILSVVLMGSAVMMLITTMLGLTVL